MTRRPAALLLALVAATAWLVAGARPAAAKSFFLARIVVDTRVGEDGSMSVLERITYDFDGEFSFATRDIPPGPYAVTDISVEAEDGRPVVLESDDPAALRWSFSAADEQVTFALQYRVLGAVAVGPDVGELFWKLVGTGHQGVGQVLARVVVPGDGQGVRAFAHGPLNGVVRVDGREVLLQVDGLPGGEFVEARVLVPSDAFAVAPSGPPRLQRVLDEERGLAAAANAERERLREEAEERAELRELGNQVGPWLPVASLLAFFALWLPWGRELRPVKDPGEYLRELPDDPPAVVSSLMRFGRIGADAFSTTLLDLARRGWLRITETREDRPVLRDKVDWRFEGMPPPQGDTLLPYEETALDLLFASGDNPVDRTQITAWANANESEGQRLWQQFRRQVRDEVRSRAYVERRRWPVMALNVLLALTILTLAVGFLGVGAWGALAALPAVVLQIAMTRTLRRRTRAGAQRAAEWGAVRRHLKDFSNLQDAPVGHLILWEKYLVYAVALGVAAELVRGLARWFPDLNAQAAFAGWYVGDMSHGRSFESLGDFGSRFGTVAQAAFTPASSSSGFDGGGFSSGGGGGGGGGGYGAG